MSLIISILNDNTIITIFRLLLSMVLATIIGIDRSKKKSPAGIKTLSLVSVGSTLIMIVSMYISNEFGNTDIARMPAQVISGIGFLGAGTILVTGKNQIRGLTSAAGIWFSACIGIAVGIGFYEAAIFSVLLEFFLLKVVSNFKIDRLDKNVFEFLISYTGNINVHEIVAAVKKNSSEFLALDNDKVKIETNVKYVVLTVNLAVDLDTCVLINDLVKIQGVEEVEEI